MSLKGSFVNSSNLLFCLGNTSLASFVILYTLKTGKSNYINKLKTLSGVKQTKKCINQQRG